MVDFIRNISKYITSLIRRFHSYITDQYTIEEYNAAFGPPVMSYNDCKQLIGFIVACEYDSIHVYESAIRACMDQDNQSTDPRYEHLLDRDLIIISPGKYSAERYRYSYCVAIIAIALSDQSQGDKWRIAPCDQYALHENNIRLVKRWVRLFKIPTVLASPLPKRELTVGFDGVLLAGAFS